VKTGWEGWEAGYGGLWGRGGWSDGLVTGQPVAAAAGQRAAAVVLRRRAAAAAPRAPRRPTHCGTRRHCDAASARAARGAGPTGRTGRILCCDGCGTDPSAGRFGRGFVAAANRRTESWGIYLTRDDTGRTRAAAPGGGRAGAGNEEEEGAREEVDAGQVPGPVPRLREDLQREHVAPRGARVGRYTMPRQIRKNDTPSHRTVSGWVC